MTKTNATLIENVNRFKCCGCGSCCHGWAIELDRSAKIKIESALEKNPHPEFGAQVEHTESGGKLYMKMRDGHCVYLQENNLCWLHANLGESNKPGICRLYPVRVAETANDARISLTPACHTAARIVLEDREFKLLPARADEGSSHSGPLFVAEEIPLAKKSVLEVEAIIGRVLERSDIPVGLRLMHAWRLVNCASPADAEPEVLRKRSQADPPRAARPPVAEQVRILQALIQHRKGLAPSSGGSAHLEQLFSDLQNAFALIDSSRRPPATIRYSRAISRWLDPQEKILEPYLVAYLRNQVYSRSFTQPFGLRDGLEIICFLYFLVRSHAAAVASLNEQPVGIAELSSAVTHIEREFSHSSIVLGFWKSILEIPNARSLSFIEHLVL